MESKTYTIENVVKFVLYGPRTVFVNSFMSNVQ